MSDAVRLAVAGLGGWGRNVVKSFAETPGSCLRAICDASAATLAAQARHYPDALATSDYSDLLRNPEIDAIAIATPSPFHYEMALEAIKAGKHVFVEKPLALRTAHAEELARLADAQRRTLMVGHLLLYHPALLAMKRLIDNGSLGRILSIECRRLNFGVIRTGENAFWSLAPHDLSVVLHLLDASPVELTAFGHCILQPNLEDAVLATLRFEDGCNASIRSSWLHPEKERKIVVVGARKMMVFDDTQETDKLKLYHHYAEFSPDGNVAKLEVHRGDVETVPLLAAEPLAEECRHFIECVRTEARPRTDGWNGVEVVRVLERVDHLLHGGASSH